MKIFKLIGASAMIFAATGVATAVAADKVDLGKREYDSNCIACHGKDLKGGAYVDFLKVTPPDLTQFDPVVEEERRGFPAGTRLCGD